MYILSLALRTQRPLSEQATSAPTTQWQCPLHCGPFNAGPRTKATAFSVSEHASLMGNNSEQEMGLTKV